MSLSGPASTRTDTRTPESPISVRNTRVATRSSDDLRDMRETLRGLVRDPRVPEDRVPLRVDLVRVDQRLEDLVVREPERPRGRRRPDREECVPDLLPVPAVEVHHHDRPDPALFHVEGGLLIELVECVGYIVLVPAC